MNKGGRTRVGEELPPALTALAETWADAARLTAGEREVLQLALRGTSPTTMHEALRIRRSSAKSRIRSVCRKLDIKSLAVIWRAVALAWIRYGVQSDPECLPLHTPGDVIPVASAKSTRDLD